MKFRTLVMQTPAWKKHIHRKSPISNPFPQGISAIFYSNFVNIFILKIQFLTLNCIQFRKISCMLFDIWTLINTLRRGRTASARLQKYALRSFDPMDLGSANRLAETLRKSAEKLRKTAETGGFKKPPKPLTR
ncbi:hypothetical protein CJD36_008395 [Flavipsychrobacter stenotrophus]|uniref:Uncharacterized protein n=1 Tax=Flavipsychrobacter stenotrophus TaxID=2077091 RepID=A0A2S7SYL2_9BACT|nr:hypothetical protein CJD36_008395 [Flavipsychrobacter stenotrophus]